MQFYWTLYTSDKRSALQYLHEERKQKGFQLSLPEQEIIQERHSLSCSSGITHVSSSEGSNASTFEQNRGSLLTQPVSSTDPQSISDGELSPLSAYLLVLLYHYQ